MTVVLLYFARINKKMKKKTTTTPHWKKHRANFQVKWIARGEKKNREFWWYSMWVHKKKKKKPLAEWQKEKKNIRKEEYSFSSYISAVQRNRQSFFLFFFIFSPYSRRLIQPSRVRSVLVDTPLRVNIYIYI